ncbi:hypothetical protein PHVU103714_03145 [Phocaeicola vulgatus]|jgi:hypothetical protein
MKKLFFLIAASFFLTSVDAQITERERPAEWQHLVKGARFMTVSFLCRTAFRLRGFGVRTVY